MFDNGLTEISSFQLSPRLERRDSKGQALDYFDSPAHKMSNYYYPPASSAPEDEAFNVDSSYESHTTQPQQYTHYQPHFTEAMTPQQQYYTDPSQYSPQPQQQQQFQQLPSYQYQVSQQQVWVQPTVPSNYPFPKQDLAPFPPFEPSTAGPSRTSTGHLSPDEAGIRQRLSRAQSYTSNASSAQSVSRSDISRSVSPNASEMAKWGFKNEDGSWSCSYPGCTSRSTFHRGCDLRKHYKRHTKSLFCRHDGCPQSTEGGFSSKKDRARHEAKHNPSIVCEWDGCERLFSRQDNMKDHVRRVHKRRIT